jgi:hypothetical protein
MIISEKQVLQLMQFAQLYIYALDALHKFDGTILTNCGLNNKINAAKILLDIKNQQSPELINIGDLKKID